jgi:hypothetical protein
MESAPLSALLLGGLRAMRDNSSGTASRGVAVLLLLGRNVPTLVSGGLTFKTP